MLGGGAFRSSQRGDTIIEVLFAVAIFSLVAVGAISIMNQGINTAQKTLEITQVRQQIDAQAEALRYIHHNYITARGTNDGAAAVGRWKELREKADIAGEVSKFGQLDNSQDDPQNSPQTCKLIPERAFILNARAATIWNGGSITPMRSGDSSAVPSSPFSQVHYDTSNTITEVDGIWIEAKTSGSSAGVGFVDFHIRACWESPGTSPPVTLGTIVRLYEPAV